ncbi:MAG: TonB-dependent receptor [Bacteroidetes bacterium]|nr:TonB-dependent receptor [Bacteroidota bacterium]
MINKKQKSYLLSVFLIIFLALFSVQATYSQVRDISGTVTEDETTLYLPGVSVSVKGTTLGTITDAEGKYTLAGVSNNAIMVFRYVGMLSQEISSGTQTTINVVMAPDLLGLEQVVVVGYGTKKKVNLTGSVSVADKELMESRPVGNVQQAVQGIVPNLVISPTAAGGEPGADMAMSIRGLSSFEGGSSPYVLVDGIPMSINDIDPDDIESISVLKDAASTSIYGARAAYGVILITTKRGQKGSRISYTMNTGWSSPTVWPQIIEGNMDWAHALNDARINGGGSPLYTDNALVRLAMNLANPGSAVPMLPSADGLGWDILNTGTKAVANDGLTDLIVDRWAPRTKHNISASGGNDVVNYYVSAGYYDEQGMIKWGDEEFDRYNLDAKINAKVTSWMKFDFLAKYNRGHEDFPWNQNYGRAWTMNWISKMKPGMPAKYPGTDIWLSNTRVEEWKNVRQNIVTNQFVASPRIILEPVKGWVTNIELNYTADQQNDVRTVKQYPWVRPNGDIAYNPQSRAQTQYRSSIGTNTYISPNIYTNYKKSVGAHNFNLMAGYRQELYQYSNLNATAFYLLSDAIPSLSTSVGEKTITDGIGHWATQSVFSRLAYNYAEKYLLEINVSSDGSSRFEDGQRWGVFPSVSAGWVISQEDFFPLQDQFDLLKLRASYGTVGNQNVANYLYIPTLPISETGQWLFNGARAWTVGTPNLTSVDLTWEQVSTMDIGIDAMLLANRLGISFGVYDSRTTNLVGPGTPLPAVLGTDVPKENEGEIQTRGWEFEAVWKNRISRDFSYEIRGVLSDYKRTVISYNNPTKLLGDNIWFENDVYYEGQVLGEIWGLEFDGYFDSQEEVDNHPTDQSYVYSGNWYAGDSKFVDQNDDGKIDIGDNTLDNHGDLVVLGNTTPRFIYGLNGGLRWKGIDISVLFQGVGKRDIDLVQGRGPFRGPAAGPMHNNVLEGHLDYWRDETSPLGENMDDPYFPRPYAQYFGQNAKNYTYSTDHFLQNAAYLRLKNIRIGYTLPSSLTEKFFVKSARFYVSGENLLTFTKMMFYDPEAFGGRWYGVGDAYPLSKTLSLGLNINF